MVSSYLKLPEKKKSDQIRSKLRWNVVHCTGDPDFYTAGYSGRTIDEFLNSLEEAGVMTLIDVRAFAVSRYKPDFSKNNLKKHLEEHGITYLHRREWGVPRAVRSFSINKPNRNDIWNWYDTNIVPDIVTEVSDTFFESLQHPVVFMCSELDPTECHRHRIFLALEKFGFIGRDL